MSASDLEELEFAGRILDNVHGFIPYTKTEEKIMNTQLFKRLQSIKQLSVANWIFPGSEHTRFIHSLGVMHLCDRIATQIHLSLEERKIVRIAGLLHDIGHYPLSHVCETPYRKDIEDYPADSYCAKVNESVRNDLDAFRIKINQDFMKSASQGHHEAMGTEIIRHCNEINQLICQECGVDAVDIICDMITGNVEREKTNPLLVQLLHSELDADGIDYLMRDALFSGTNFGNFELDQLINSMSFNIFYDKPILTISPKGIAAADQYLINKFFSYSQIVFNKHISVLEWMAQQVTNWMQKNDVYFPPKKHLLQWVEQGTDFGKYISFTDNYFWTALQQVLDNPLSQYIPPFIYTFCAHLLQHEELEYVENSELRMVSNSEEDIRTAIQRSRIYQDMNKWNDKFVIFESRPMTKHAPYDLFMESLRETVIKSEELDNNDLQKAMQKRLMEGICVADGTDLHLLCDDSRSLMQQLYNTHLIILRAYKFPQNSVQ